MKTKLRLLLLLPLILLTVQKAAGQTFHFIYFSDTNDSRIGKNSEEANRYFLNNFIPQLKKSTGLEVKQMIYTGNSFSRHNLENATNSLDTGYGDVIFFYYSGHGYNDGSSVFPTMTLGLQGDELDSRTKHILDVYNQLRRKPHKLLVVIAEACNAVYSTRGVKGSAVVSYDAYEGNNDNYYSLFRNSSGDYLMSSCKQGQKSWSPMGGLSYFATAFRDVLDERRTSVTWREFLDGVSSKTLDYVDRYAGETQQPQWISGEYTGTALSTGSLTATTTAKPEAEITSVTQEHNVTVNGKKGLNIHVKFDISNFKGKDGYVAVYYYDSDKKPITDTDGNYKTSGNPSYVAHLEEFKPRYDNSTYNDFKLFMPYEQLHQTGTEKRTLYFKIDIWDTSGNDNKNIYNGSTYYSFSFTPEQPYLTVDGNTDDIYKDFGEHGGRKTYYVGTNDNTYELWGIPTWCSVEDRTSGQFTLVCESNPYEETRDDYMLVKAAGKEIRINITQEAKSSPSAEINSVNIEHNTFRDGWKGMIVHVDLSVSGLMGRKCYAVANIYNAVNHFALITPQGGALEPYAIGNVNHEHGHFDDLEIFIPYAAIILSSGGSNTFYLNVSIYDDERNELDKSDNLSFYSM